MLKHSGITTSINLTIGSLFLFQVSGYLGILFYYDVNPSNAGVVVFILSSAAIHIGLWIFLSTMHDHFILLETGEKLRHINFANKLTLFRISSIPTVTLLLILVHTHPVLPLLGPFIAALFLTDLFDGAIARGSRQITRIGKYLDSISDYSILIVVSVVMAFYGIIPDWFFLLVSFRLIFQWIGMGALLIYQGYLLDKATLLGKASVFSIMALYGLEVLALTPVLQRPMAPILFALEYFVAFVMAISLIEKVVILKRGFVQAKEVRKNRRHPAAKEAHITE